MTATVRIEVEAAVATVTIDRPEVRNAIDRETAEGLAAAFDEADRREDVAAIVLTGAGPTFSRHGPEGLHGDRRAPDK